MLFKLNLATKSTNFIKTLLMYIFPALVHLLSRNRDHHKAALVIQKQSKLYFFSEFATNDMIIYFSAGSQIYVVNIEFNKEIYEFH